MTTSFKKLVLSVALVAFAACVGTDVGNGAVDVDFVLYDSGGAAVNRPAVAPAGLVVDGAWIAVERVRLRDAADCNGGNETDLVGPFAIDMLDGAVPGPLQQQSIPLTDYCRVEVRWDVLDGAISGVPTELVGASILLQGQRADGTRFVLRSERGDELRLDARDGAFTVDDATSALFVAFDVQQLFDGVDIDAAEVSADDVIRIEDGTNDDLLAVFDDNLADAAKLFDDKDGDSALDPDERDATDVLAD